MSAVSVDEHYGVEDGWSIPVGIFLFEIVEI